MAPVTPSIFKNSEIPTILADTLFNGVSPYASFAKQSKDYMTEMAPVNNFGMIAGFAIFGIMYIYVFYAIVMDIQKSYKENREYVEQDIADMKELEMDITSFDVELEERLSNKKKEAGSDDQLLGAASSLAPADYQKFM